MRAKVFLVSALVLFSTGLTACGGRVPSAPPAVEEPDTGAPPADENPPTPPTEPQDPAPPTGGDLQEQAAMAWAFINTDGDEIITPEELTTFFLGVINSGMATARVAPRQFRTQQYRPLPPRPQMQRFSRVPAPTLRRMNDADPNAGVAELMTQDFFNRFDADADMLLNYMEFETGFIALAQEGAAIQTYATRNPNGARIMRMRQALLTGR